jgi:hypothetical protein
MEQSEMASVPQPMVNQFEKLEEPLRGAEAIAEFIFGDRRHKRKVYYLAECSKVPIYRLGATLCLRPSVFRHWIENQETQSIKNADT